MPAIPELDVKNMRWSPEVGLEPASAPTVPPDEKRDVWDLPGGQIRRGPEEMPPTVGDAHRSGEEQPAEAPVSSRSPTRDGSSVWRLSKPASLLAHTSPEKQRMYAGTPPLLDRHITQEEFAHPILHPARAAPGLSGDL